jgi:hypothetical protein
MNQPTIEPHRITKPIQLLGAWLAGLAIINSTFLIAAARISAPTWLPAMLAIAAVANVPLFILSLFLLQTKFRPEMQEDAYYSRYLEQRYSKPPPVPIDVEKNVQEVAERVIAQIHERSPEKKEKVIEILRDAELDALKERFATSRTLGELYLYRDSWSQLVDKWVADPDFQEDFAALRNAGLIAVNGKSIKTTELTEIGRKIAKRLELEKRLWHQKHPDRDQNEHPEKMG